MTRYLDWFRRNLAAIAFISMVLFASVGLHFWAKEQDHRLNDNNRRITEITTVCRTFVTKHNAFVLEDVQTLKDTLAAHYSPAAEKVINERIDAYYRLIVNPNDCLPKGH